MDSLQEEGVFQERQGKQTEHPMDNRSDINTGGWDHPLGRECHVMSNTYCTYTLWWTNIAIENGHRNSGFSMIFPLKMVIFRCYVSSPEGTTYLLRDSTSRHICHGHLGSLLGCGARALSSHGEAHLLKAVGNTVVGTECRKCCKLVGVVRGMLFRWWASKKGPWVVTRNLKLEF